MGASWWIPLSDHTDDERNTPGSTPARESVLTILSKNRRNGNSAGW